MQTGRIRKRDQLRVLKMSNRLTRTTTSPRSLLLSVQRNQSSASMPTLHKLQPSRARVLCSLCPAGRLLLLLLPRPLHPAPHRLLLLLHLIQPYRANLLNRPRPKRTRSACSTSGSRWTRSVKCSAIGSSPTCASATRSKVEGTTASSSPSSFAPSCPKRFRCCSRT